MPEFLVCFQTLERIAKEYGLTLKLRMNFHDYHRNMTTEHRNSHKHQQLLRMMVMGRPEVQKMTQAQIEQ